MTSPVVLAPDNVALARRSVRHYYLGVTLALLATPLWIVLVRLVLGPPVSPAVGALGLVVTLMGVVYTIATKLRCPACHAHDLMLAYSVFRNYTKPCPKCGAPLP